MSGSVGTDQAGPDGLGRRVADAEAAVFQGRQAELEAVLAHLATPGRLPGVVAVTGSPGIGKTAFLYALGRACGDRDAADVAIIGGRFPGSLPGRCCSRSTRSRKCGISRTNSRDVSCPVCAARCWLC